MYFSHLRLCIEWSACWIWHRICLSRYTEKYWTGEAKLLFGLVTEFRITSFQAIRWGNSWIMCWELLGTAACKVVEYRVQSLTWLPVEEKHVHVARIRCCTTTRNIWMRTTNSVFKTWKLVMKTEQRKMKSATLFGWGFFLSASFKTVT